MTPSKAHSKDIPSAVELPSNAEIQSEKDATRKEILAAMQRILLGHPKHVPPGAISISHLAKEAGVGRHFLYQTHPDMRYRYEYLRDRANEPTEREAELQQVLDRAKSDLAKTRVLHASVRQEASSWKGLTELLARVINVLQAELHKEQMKTERLTRRLRQLEEQSGSASTVVLMHRRRGNEP